MTKSMISVNIARKLIVVCCLVMYEVQANFEAKRLYNDLMSSYNKLVRPVEHSNQTLLVRFGLRLTQLLDVDEKNQIMTTNVWVIHEWHDTSLTWDETQYNGVRMLYVPASEIWLPDIVLYNNADGPYVITTQNTKATVFSDGRVRWEPPAIYKSSCEINVEFFPFDEQKCHMKFGSWSFDGIKVDLQHIERDNSVSDLQQIENGIELKDYYQSGEWDVMAVPAKKHIKKYTCCPEHYPDIFFYINIRRKTLFYTVNLIIPCVGISFLSVLVFFLPSDSCEKITLCISILLSLTVFFLVLADINPPTSLTVPLIGKYLLFTMILVTASVFFSTAVININFRKPSTHTMSPWMRSVFLEILPRLLLMQRPKESEKKDKSSENIPSAPKYPYDNLRTGLLTERYHSPFEDDKYVFQDLDCEAEEQNLSIGVLTSLHGVSFMAEHMKSSDEEEDEIEDWKYMAYVLDRLFLWIFTAACVLGTFGIILRAPSMYDERIPIA